MLSFLYQKKKYGLKNMYSDVLSMGVRRGGQEGALDPPTVVIFPLKSETNT